MTDTFVCAGCEGEFTRSHIVLEGEVAGPGISLCDACNARFMDQQVQCSRCGKGALIRDIDMAASNEVEAPVCTSCAT